VGATINEGETDVWSSPVAELTTTGPEQEPVPAQTPAVQMSPVVHEFPSLHEAPLAAAGFEHTPDVGSQTPATWHWSEAAQVTTLAPVQVPVWQVSVWVQAFPSLHDDPFALAGFEHVPLVGSQVPALWHWSLAVHVIPFDPVQVPAWQVSVCVQALPSEQALPSVLVGFEQTPVPVLHTPAT
jgi:hypothetical protein